MINNNFKNAAEAGTAWLSDFAHHGRIYSKYGPNFAGDSICDNIYAFMAKYKIGSSEFGKIMDMAGAEKGVFLHRLYGHHLLYDFPWKNPEHTIDFLVHEFSDFFTKNGLPIIPGEFLENAPKWLKKICITNQPCKSWNFINGFDLLAGTIAIYTAGKDLQLALANELSIDTVGDFAKMFGVGAIEFAIAISTANPLLLLGSLLQITAGVRALFNDGDVIYMQRQQFGLSLKFSLQICSLEAALQTLEIDRSHNSLSLENSINQQSRMSFE